MAKTVNANITDSITQTNTQVGGIVPSSAMGNLFSAIGQAMSNASANATSAQQYAGITSQAATVQGINSLQAIGSSVISRASEEVIEKG